MSKQQWYNLGIIVMLAGVIIYGVVVTGQVHKLQNLQAMQPITIEKQVTVNVDSIRTAIERRVQDSVAAVVTRLDSKIKNIRDENEAFRQQNRLLRSTYDSIFIERPDF